MLFTKKNKIYMDIIINGKAHGKYFRNTESAERYVNSMLDQANLQVNGVIQTENRTEYYCNDLSRFIIYR